MRTKITGLTHSDFKTVAETLCVGNMATVIHDPKWDKPAGKAYRVECKGQHIGYLPLVATLRGYYNDAQSDEAKQRIAEWGRATVEVRDWLESRQKYEFEAEWIVRVAEILYKRSDGTYTTNDMEGKKHLAPEQVSIEFDGIN